MHNIILAYTEDAEVIRTLPNYCRLLARYHFKNHHYLSTLLSHPEIGPRRYSLAKGLRAHFHRGYVLYYRFTATEVIIVRVVHGTRDMRASMFDEE